MIISSTDTILLAILMDREFHLILLGLDMFIKDHFSKQVHEMIKESVCVNTYKMECFTWNLGHYQDTLIHSHSIMKDMEEVT